MNRLFLDTEFNGFGGELLSIALVPEDGSQLHFYQELTLPDRIDPWVLDNVIPHRRSIPVSYNTFQNNLASYLWTIGDCTIIADWPDDIRYFCQALISGPGNRINVPNNIGFYLDFSIEYESKVPHNALHDALAIREHYIKTGK